MSIPNTHTIQVWPSGKSDNATSEKKRETFLHKGDRVRLRRNVDRFPHDVVEAGERGIVVEVDVFEHTGTVHMVSVQLLKFHENLSEWSNCLHWYFDDETVNDIPEDLEVLL